MDKEEILKGAFSTVGKRYGYDRIGAEYVAYRDFKVKWTRSYKWADFQVSDYLADAPECVLEDLAETLFSRITGGEDRAYGPELTGFITSAKFREDKQPIYVRRSRNITRSPDGEHKSLADSLQRLKDMGLVSENAEPYLTWTKDELTSLVGFCSTLMDVIVISSALDTDAVEDYVLDYALYHQCLVIRDGWVNFNKGVPFDFRAEEKKFPKWKEAEEFISRMCLRF